MLKTSRNGSFQRRCLDHPPLKNEHQTVKNNERNLTSIREHKQNTLAFQEFQVKNFSINFLLTFQFRFSAVSCSIREFFNLPQLEACTQEVCRLNLFLEIKVD